MVLTELDIVKDFIDYLTWEYNKTLYYILRAEGQTPSDIYYSNDWAARKESITDRDAYAYYLDDEDFLDNIIFEYQRDTYWPELEDICHGAEQIVFIFKDIVYKITTTAVNEILESFVYNMGEEFEEIFPLCIYQETYRGCEIFTQEKVEMWSEDYYTRAKEQGIEYLDSRNIGSCDCCAAIALQFDEHYLKRLDAKMDEYYYNFDIHEENWGVNKEGKVRIFDPIFYGER
jgi:hypothetical protein